MLGLKSAFGRCFFHSRHFAQFYKFLKMFSFDMFFFCSVKSRKPCCDLVSLTIYVCSTTWIFILGTKLLFGYVIDLLAPECHEKVANFVSFQSI